MSRKFHMGSKGFGGGTQRVLRRFRGLSSSRGGARQWRFGWWKVGGFGVQRLWREACPVHVDGGTLERASDLRRWNQKQEESSELLRKLWRRLDLGQCMFFTGCGRGSRGFDGSETFAKYSRVSGYVHGGLKFSRHVYRCGGESKKRGSRLWPQSGRDLQGFWRGLGGGTISRPVYMCRGQSSVKGRGRILKRLRAFSTSSYIESPARNQ